MNDVLHFYMSFIDKVMHGLNLVSLFFPPFSLVICLFDYVLFRYFFLCVFFFFNLIVNYYVKFKYHIVILV